MMIHPWAEYDIGEVIEQGINIIRIMHHIGE